MNSDAIPRLLRLIDIIDVLTTCDMMIAIMALELNIGKAHFVKNVSVVKKISLIYVSQNVYRPILVFVSMCWHHTLTNTGHPTYISPPRFIGCSHHRFHS